jgi:predicted ArsR family transcriptional regulator
MSRRPPIRARILTALTDEPISAQQIAERAGITARRRGEVVKLACDVLEDEGLIERVGGRRHPRWRRPNRSTADMCTNTTSPPSSGWTAPGLDDRLVHELVQGLVQSAIARGVDPATRLREFRTLQHAAGAMSQDPTIAETAERLVRAIDLALQELASVKS